MPSDLIAIPDFSAGAMENWGLITYRENSLLFSESQTSVIAKQWIAVVVAHELAHQWFGNLVTMKWWNDIWLNEGENEPVSARALKLERASTCWRNEPWLGLEGPGLKLGSHRIRQKSGLAQVCFFKLD